MEGEMDDYVQTDFICTFGDGSELLYHPSTGQYIRHWPAWQPGERKILTLGATNAIAAINEVCALMTHELDSRLDVDRMATR